MGRESWSGIVELLLFNIFNVEIFLALLFESTFICVSGNFFLLIFAEGFYIDREEEIVAVVV